MNRNWKPLTQESLLKECPPDSNDWFLLIADSTGKSYSGRLVRCGPSSLELDRAGNEEHVRFGNRAFQFMLIGAPPRKIFKSMEKDLFDLRVAEPPSHPIDLSAT